MNLKKFISLLFIMLLGVSSFAFAANNNRNVYSVYSDNFIGAHIYGVDDVIPSDDEDGVKIDLWNQGKGLDPVSHSTGGAEGKEYISYAIKANLWDVASYAPKNSSGLSPRNMGAYAGGQIKFWARSSNSSFGTATVGFQYRIGSSDYPFTKTLSELEFNANGQWQELTIPLPSDNLNNVISLFLFQANTLTVGDSIDIDNIRWVKGSGTASFSVVRKSTSTHEETTDPISFSKGTFGQGWKAADQYLEMDIDGEFSSNNWTVRIYSSNDIAGLYNASDPENILPMAWKASWTTLPFNYTDDDGPNANTLKIGENKQGENIDLYDAGKVETTGNEGLKWWYPWFYLKANSDTTADSLVINNVGCHTFRNTRSGQSVPDQYFDTPITSCATDTYERKPKLFLACDTKKAKSLKYEASLVVNLSYE